MVKIVQRSKESVDCVFGSASRQASRVLTKVFRWKVVGK